MNKVDTEESKVWRRQRNLVLGLLVAGREGRLCYAGRETNVSWRITSRRWLLYCSGGGGGGDGGGGVIAGPPVTADDCGDDDDDDDALSVTIHSAARVTTAAAAGHVTPSVSHKCRGREVDVQQEGSGAAA